MNELHQWPGGGRHNISRYPAGSAYTTTDYKRNHVPPPECGVNRCRMRVQRKGARCMFHREEAK